MKRFCFLLLCLLLTPIWANGQQVINNFDEQPNPDFFRKWSGSENSFVNYSIITDQVYEGTGAMQLEWQVEAIADWGGWAKVEELYPDSSGTYNFSGYSHLSLWFYNSIPSSAPGHVEFRIHFYDVSDAPVNTYDAGQMETWYSHHYILDLQPGWNQILMPMRDVGHQTNGEGFWLPGWAGILGNGQLDLDKIKGYGLEFSVDGSLYNANPNFATGTIYVDNFTVLSPPSETAQITFQADMTGFIADGSFDPGNPADSIVVNASFNGWDSHEKMTPDVGNPNIYVYTTTLTMIPDDIIDWKFRAFPPERWVNQGWEIGDNRQVIFTGDDIILDPIVPNIEYAGEPISQDVTVTFSVDMSTYNEAEPFTIVSLQGDKPPIDWNPGSTLMSDPDGDNIWTVNVIFPQGTGRKVWYKYTAGDNPWHWEPFSGNRQFEIDDSSPNQVLDLDYWGHLQKPYYGPVWYVSTTGDNNNNGSADYPFRNISYGIEKAQPGDTVYVFAGWYEEGVNLKSNVLLMGQGADVTTIYGTVFCDGQSNATFQGFTVTDNQDAGIHIYRSTASIRNCIVRNQPHSGIGCWDNTHVTLINNTVLNNGHAGVSQDNSEVTLINNILINNNDGIGTGGTSSLVIDYNNIWNNANNYSGNASPGAHDISVNPLFVNSSNDLHLQLGSPCIDAGDPDPVYNDIDGSRNDMGAFGGSAGKSYTYEDGPPVVENVVINPVIVAPGNAVTITAHVWDVISTVSSVQAEIETPDENVVATLVLYDDGAHSDGAAGDNTYGNSWITPSGEFSYFVDIIATDDQSHTANYNNMGSFIVHVGLVLIDGEKDDFYNTLTGPDNGYLQIRSYAWNDNGRPADDADLSAKIWSAWDEGWLYQYIEVMDDTVAGNANNVWENDCIELKVDPQPTDANQGLNSIWETRLTALGLETPGVVTADNLNTVSDYQKQWVRKIIPGGYALEMAIEWSAVRAENETITPAVDNIFGMAIMNHDNDGWARRQASVMWAAVMKDAVWNTPKYHGTVKFLADHQLQFIPKNNMTGVTNLIPYDGSDYIRNKVYVSLSNTSDTEEGTMAYPYNTIQEGINAAYPGDTVYVAEGTYYENPGIGGKTLQLLGGYDAASWIRNISEHKSIIDGNENGTVLAVWYDGVLVSGFTLRNSGHEGWNTGLYCNANNVMVENCYVTDNNDGVIFDNTTGCKIENCIVTQNTYATLLCWSSSLEIINNVFEGGGEGIYCNNSPSSTIIKNNIIVNNLTRNGGIYCEDSSPTISYNDVWNNSTDYNNCSPGEGDISLNPKFVNLTAGNFHLQLGSPCINAGDPDPSYNDKDGSRNDMGAYGGPEGESYTYTAPVSGTVSYDGTGRPVSNAIIKLTHPEIAASDTTDVNGQYIFKELSGGAVTLVPAKKGDQRDAITLSDALMVLYYRVSLINLTSDQKIAADVDENGHIDLMDATGILRYAAFLPPKNDHTGAWKFFPADTSFNHTAEALVDFKAYLLGDVSLNWEDAGSTMAKAGEHSRAILALGEPVKTSEQEVRIPILLETNNEEVNSVFFTLQYDSSLFTYKATALTALSQGFIQVTNDKEAGRLHLAMVNVKGITGPGAVLNLSLALKKGANKHSTELNFVRAYINDLATGTLNSLNIDFENLRLGIPQEFKLSGNYPNPFNPETTIEYQIPNDVKITLRIYDVLGKEIKTLVDEDQNAGYYKVLWNGTDKVGMPVASGVYFYRLEADQFQATRRMILVR